MLNRHSTKRIVVIFLIIVGILIFICASIIYNAFNIAFYDYAWLPSEKRETIDVYYITWGCDCADFTYYPLSGNDIGSLPDDSVFFIESTNPTMQVDTGFYSSGHFSKYLRLTGSFYTDKGISRDYELKTPIKPEHTRVFRYDKIEYINYGTKANPK